MTKQSDDYDVVRDAEARGINVVELVNRKPTVSTQPRETEALSPVDDMYQMMDFCNGEVRIMANRYGGGFSCVISLVERHDESWWDRWEDLVGGDNDYFEARDYLESKAKQVEDHFGFGWGKTPAEALKAAEQSAIEARKNI